MFVRLVFLIQMENTDTISLCLLSVSNVGSNYINS